MTLGKHLRPALALLGLMMIPALHASPTLKSGLWRYDVRILNGGQSSTRTLEHCYKHAHPLKPDTPKECAAPVLHVQGSTARWVVACTLGNGMVHIHSQGVITYLHGGNAFRETSVSRIVMPATGSRIFKVQMIGTRLGACPKG